MIIEAQPELKNPDSQCITDVKTALMNSASPLDESKSHDSRWGYGAINGESWLNEIRSSGACL